MKKNLLLFSLALLLVTSLAVFAIGCGGGEPPTPPSRAVDAIVSTAWLETNIDNPDLVILDNRDPTYYTAGHIPGAINVPGLGNFYLYLFSEEVPWMELPGDGALFTTIGNAGITGDSIVVVVGRTIDPLAGFAVADSARIAITLLYAGVENVTILDGGYDKWVAEGKDTSTVAVTPTAVTYTGVVDEAMFVSKDYVEDKMGESTLVSARDPNVYYGIELEPWTVRAGHIPTAKNLPSPWLWTFTLDEDGVITYGTWKDTDTLREMAFAVLGEDASEEIIVHCGVGGYASPLWYVLTQMIGYTNVKIFDGSMQEWTADPEAPVNKYQYQ
jgi:thiosulfate/3-mercaptopyruvate sulfurtransferase